MIYIGYFFLENFTATVDGGWYIAKRYSEWGPFYRIAFIITVQKAVSERTEFRSIFQIDKRIVFKMKHDNTFIICTRKNHCITSDFTVGQKYHFVIQMYPKNNSIWTTVKVNGSVINHEENFQSVEISQDVILRISRNFLQLNGILENFNVTRIDKMETKGFACSPPGKL